MSHKKSWDRSDPIKAQEAEYWKTENVEKRRMLVEEQKQKYEKFKAEYDYPNNASKSDKAIDI